ncbi:hypothetical protein ACEUZ9_005464 [Paracoccus litorisediminis]|uniref:hypothetical protein n=1 Tax=Paracoccus litorisediminis TaxID=2006130 RepID=UPI0037324B61
MNQIDFATSIATQFLFDGTIGLTVLLFIREMVRSVWQSCRIARHVGKTWRRREIMHGYADPGARFLLLFRSALRAEFFCRPYVSHALEGRDFGYRPWRVLQLASELSTPRTPAPRPRALRANRDKGLTLNEALERSETMPMPLPNRAPQPRPDPDNRPLHEYTRPRRGGAIIEAHARINQKKAYQRLSASEKRLLREAQQAHARETREGFLGEQSPLAQEGVAHGGYRYRKMSL